MFVQRLEPNLYQITLISSLFIFFVFWFSHLLFISRGDLVPRVEGKCEKN